jgi:hypothetical protein
MSAGCGLLRLQPYRARATVDGHSIAGAQPAAAVHRVYDTRDSEFTGNDGAAQLRAPRRRFVAV